MCRSVPQIVVWVTLTIASVDASMRGLGRSSKDLWSGPRYTRAFMADFLVGMTWIRQPLLRREASGNQFCADRFIDDVGFSDFFPGIGRLGNRAVLAGITWNLPIDSNGPWVTMN